MMKKRQEEARMRNDDDDDEVIPSRSFSPDKMGWGGSSFAGGSLSGSKTGIPAKPAAGANTSTATKMSSTFGLLPESLGH